MQRRVRLRRVGTAGDRAGDGSDASGPTRADAAHRDVGRIRSGRWLSGRPHQLGELAISAYGVVRYMDQTPGAQTFVDHLGNERPIDGRNDMFPHRIIVYLKGWLADPKLVYNVFFWTVNPTDQGAIFINLGYQFSRKFSLYAGINGNPGTRSLQGSHPYWLGHDRVMADEFFRPYFGSGVWAQGEAFAGFWYNAHDRQQQQRARRHGVATGSSLHHRRLGVVDADDEGVRPARRLRRLGMAREGGDALRRLDDAEPRAALHRHDDRSPANTTLRLADSVNVFDAGALAPGVTVDQVDFRILSFDAGMKYSGFFLQTEIYHRWLDNFDADGRLPVSSILDRGFYVQGAFYPLPKKLELYGATSQIFGDKDAGFGNELRVPGRDELLPVQHAQSPVEPAGDQREPFAGQQHVRLLRRRPEGHHVFRGVLGLLLDGHAHDESRL